MKFTYDVYAPPHRRIHTCVRFEALERYLEDLDKENNAQELTWAYIVVTDNFLHCGETVIRSKEDLQEWRGTLERVHAWKPEKKDVSNDKIAAAVNPSHYASYMGGLEGFMEELQWLEAMQYTHDFREPEKFLAALQLQYRKYLDRNGKKDNAVQELLKSVWYIRFEAAYRANGNKPIRVADIPYLLGELKREVDHHRV